MNSKTFNKKKFFSNLKKNHDWTTNQLRVLLSTIRGCGYLDGGTIIFPMDLDIVTFLEEVKEKAAD